MACYRVNFTFTFYLYSLLSGMPTVCCISCVYRHQIAGLVVSVAIVLAASEHGLLLKKFNLLLNRVFDSSEEVTLMNFKGHVHVLVHLVAIAIYSPKNKCSR